MSDKQEYGFMERAPHGLLAAGFARAYAVNPSVASLIKRSKIDNPHPVAWQTLFASGVEPRGSKEEAFCFEILMCLSLQAGVASARVPFGVGLGKAGYSEARLRRLLSPANERLSESVYTALRYLVAKGIAVQIDEIANLLFFRNERARKSIARGYFRTISA